VFVFGLDGGWVAEVDFYSLTHYGFTIKNLTDSNRGVFVEEGNDDAAETLEWGP